jgi:hypothetical protein
MAPTWHDDLAGDDAEAARGLPLHARRRRRFVHAVVEAATARGAGGPAVTAVRCVAALSGSRGARCGDWVYVTRDARDPEGAIAWSCPGCGENGFVRGYARGPCDLTRWAASRADVRHWAPSDAELALLDDTSDERPDVRAILARALPDPELGPQVGATLGELETLYAFAASLLETTLSDDRQDLVEVLRIGLQSALDVTRRAAGS